MQPGCARSIPVTLRLVLRADERICQKWLLIRQKNISKRRVIHSKSSACSELLMRSLQQGLIVKMQTRSRREQPGKYLGNISCNAALGEQASPAGALRERNTGMASGRMELQCPLCMLSCSRGIWKSFEGLVWDLGGDKYIKGGMMSCHFFCFREAPWKTCLTYVLFAVYFPLSPPFPRVWLYSCYCLPI